MTTAPRGTPTEFKSNTKQKMMGVAFATLSLLFCLRDFAYLRRFSSRHVTLYAFELRATPPDSSHESLMGVLPRHSSQALPGPTEIFIASLSFNKHCTLKLSRLPDFPSPHPTAPFPCYAHLHRFAFLLLRTHRKKENRNIRARTKVKMDFEHSVQQTTRTLSITRTPIPCHLILTITYTHTHIHLSIHPFTSVCPFTYLSLSLSLSISPSLSLYLSLSLSLSLCFGPLACPSLHAKVLSEVGGEAEGGWRVGCDAGGHRWRRRGQIGDEVGCGGDDLLLAVPWHLMALAHHRLVHGLHRGLQISRRETHYTCAMHASVSMAPTHHHFY
ncbi:hypothetical protein AALO_G00174250 [Alosa alosa]|uniref:Uncharacterized protein n=1 Tax=Alosa alosa TaxID=278164 RepID=A0AAV6G7D0_9TELE|nr:hypothetical protein AALO_G00174250 [Alosa alosa]